MAPGGHQLTNKELINMNGNNVVLIEAERVSHPYLSRIGVTLCVIINQGHT